VLPPSPPGFLPWTEYWGEQNLCLHLRIRVNTVSRRIGPNDLSFGLLNPDNNTIAQTVTDNLFQQGKIQKNQVAVSFEPTNSIPTVNGELTFGGVDSSKYIGDMYYL
jgi:aspartyl protease